MSANPLPRSVEAAIEAKCGSIRSLSLAWRTAARKAMAAGGSEAMTRSLVEGFSSSRNLERLLEGLGGGADGLNAFWAELLEAVDASDWSLEQWLAALERLQAWLGQRSRRAGARAALGYVHCCAAYRPGAESGEGLADLVGGMLDRYGFEGREGCSTDAAG